METMFCKSCNANDPPHAPDCWAADLHDAHEKGKLNGLLHAQAIALRCAIDAPTPEAREAAEVVAGMVAGAALGLSLHLPTRLTPESRLAISPTNYPSVSPASAPNGDGPEG